MPTFADMRKDVRQPWGLSQAELTHELGLSFATLNRWEKRQDGSWHICKDVRRSLCERMQEQGKGQHDQD